MSIFKSSFKFYSPKQLLGSLLNIVVYGLAVVGIIQVAAGFRGSEMVQPFRSLAVIQPELMKTRALFLTKEIKNEDSPEAHWQALQPTVRLLWAINPEISGWLEKMNREKRMIWQQQPTLFNWPVLACYEWRSNNLYFGPDFWQLSEADKAAAIAHEYFHYRQNKWWMVGDTILEAVTGKLPEYGSRTEDEAFLYQWFAYRAMGMPPTDLLQGYFNQRKLYRFVLSQD